MEGERLAFNKLDKRTGCCAGGLVAAVCLAINYAAGTVTRLVLVG